MPIAKKHKKEEVTNEKLLNSLPDKNFIEVAIGENIYSLYSLPKDSFMKLSSTVKNIVERIQSDMEDKKTEIIEAVKNLTNVIGKIDTADVQQQVINLSNELSLAFKETNPLDLLFHPAFQEDLERILDVCLEGVDEEDRKTISADQLAKISEAIFVLNFLGFIRTIKNASYFFRS